MSEPQEDQTGRETAPESIAFEYIKSNAFRVIHVDGAVGGLTPQGRIHFAIYSERGAIPQRVVHTVLNADGSVQVGPEIPEERVARQAIIRELEADIIVDVDTAKGLRDWLTRTINRVEGDAS